MMITTAKTERGLGGTTTRRLSWLTLFASLLFVAVSPNRVFAQAMKTATEERVKKAAVLVFTAISEKQKGDRPMGSGSGYFINNTGLLISNNHVVDPVHGRSDQEKQRFHYTAGTLTWTVVLNAGTEDEKTYEATVVYQNETADQAVLQAFTDDGEKLETPEYLHLQPQSRLRQGMKVFALGFPGGDRQRTVKDKHPKVTITEGHVLRNNGIPRTPGGRVRMIYTDVEARPGNSGGPMVDLDGYLVGTVTLMTKPEEREDTGGAKYSALVPAALTADMIRYAFDLRKIPDGSDVTPFMEMLTDDRGYVNIPEFKRLPNEDVIYFEDGDRFHGTVNNSEIHWHSPLGDITVPTSTVAYIINNDEGSHLFLEGGNRISTEDLDSTIEFTPQGGEAVTKDILDLQVIAFRTEGRDLESAGGKTVIVDADLTHLRLKNVEGKVKFEGKLGAIEIGLEEIERIDQNEYEETYVSLRDGRRLTGEFGDQKYKAVLAMGGSPIEFGLNEVSSALVQTVYEQDHQVAGLGLQGVLSQAGPEVQEIVELLEEKGDAEGAYHRVEKIVSERSFRERTKSEQEQFNLLYAVTAMRAGKFDEAKKQMRRARKSDELNISAYALACGEVLDRHEENYQFEGKPLSDKPAFVAAGSKLARELIAKVRDVLTDLNDNEGKYRGDYFRAINSVKRYEDDMRVAAIFVGEEADDEMIRLWKAAESACQKELRRIEQEREDTQEKFSGRGRNGGLALQRAMEELDEHREKVMETRREYLIKMYEYGFRIEDPDIQAERERNSKRRAERDGPDPDEP